MIADIKPIYIPGIYVLNKIDQISIEELDIISKIPHCVPISAHHEWNFDDLLACMWEKLNLCRIYTKPKGRLHSSCEVSTRPKPSSAARWCRFSGVK